VEGGYARAVRGNRVIGQVAPDDLPQPTALLGYRLVHAAAQLLSSASFACVTRDEQENGVCLLMSIASRMIPRCLPSNNDRGPLGFLLSLPGDEVAEPLTLKV
jgi:hypothetical protein